MKSWNSTLLLCLLAAGCNGQPRLYPKTRGTLGPVPVTIQVVATGRWQARQATNEALAAVSQVNNLLSSYLPHSEVSTLNRNAGRACHVSSQTATVLRRAKEIAELTDGAFDVTAGPLITLWKRTMTAAERYASGERKTPPKPPTTTELDQARKLVGYRRLELAENSARLALEGMHIDLGGIAKGHAVDKAVEALRANGVQGSLIDAGGDGYALGTRPDGTPWRVGIRHPRGKRNERLARILLLSDMAYATSGDYEQYTEIDGVRYAHIIDPRTGRPAPNAVSVTVLAPDCTTADALATAVTVLGPGEGLRIIETLDRVECMIITADADGALRIVTSRGFGAFLAD